MPADPGSPAMARWPYAGRSEQEARRTAMEIWPNAAITGQATNELPLPLHFEQLAKLVKQEDIEQSVICGPRPERHISRRFGNSNGPASITFSFIK